MILYSDEKTRNLEADGNWIDCIQYLLDKWRVNKDNIQLFLKLVVNSWYVLTLDGLELSLSNEEYDSLSRVLLDTYKHFSNSLANNDNCQWIFGYIMEIRADLFLNSGFEYDAIVQEGKLLIERASSRGNLIAQLLFSVDHHSKKIISAYREKVKMQISGFFDNSQEVDRYFIEILTTEFH